MVDREPNTEQLSCCSMTMFVSAQQAPAGRVSVGERWTLMGHPLTCSRTGLAGFGVFCTSDALLTYLHTPSLAHYKNLPLL